MPTNTGVNGRSEVRFTIHAPVIPRRTSTSGITQHVEAMIEDVTATATSPMLNRFIEASPSDSGEKDLRRVVSDMVQAVTILDEIVYLKASGSSGSIASPLISACGYMKNPTLPF